MKQPVVVVGLGQLGCVFSEAFLRAGHPVFPVRREDDIGCALDAAGGLHQGPPLTVIATGEDDLKAVLDRKWGPAGGHVVLLQNELRPATLSGTGIQEPTVCVVWFEKKPQKIITEVRPSVVFGPYAERLRDALSALAVRVEVLGAADSPGERAHQLILKNLYILGLNLSGLDAPGSAGEVLKEHTELLRAVTSELITLEQKSLEKAASRPKDAPRLSAERLEEDLRAAILSDPDHGASGRSAKRRLERTLALARSLGLSLTVLEDLASRHL